MAERHSTDVNVARITLLGAALAAVVVVVALATHLSLFRIDLHPGPGAGRRSPLAREALPPEPRLQISPPADMAALREHDRQVLETYGWVDRAHGVVRIPIEEAKKMVLRQGLPSR
jgi:hypothetical protein